MPQLARKCRLQLNFEPTHHLYEDRTTEAGVNEANHHCVVPLLPVILLDSVDQSLKYGVFLKPSLCMIYPRNFALQYMTQLNRI